MSARAQFSLALVLQLVGSGTVLLVSTREWQTITTPRTGQPAAVLSVAGRTLDNASLALGLVGLAGVVAILATQRVVRRIIGALVALAGAGIVFRSAHAIPAVGAARARELVREKQSRVTLSDSVIPHVATHVVWGALSIAGALLVVVAGLLIAVLGGHWATMSARYERVSAEPDEEQARILADRSLWNALDRGEDPTSAS